MSAATPPPVPDPSASAADATPPETPADWASATHPDPDRLDKALEAAKRLLPEGKSAYEPSGTTSFMAVLAMLVASPIALLAVLVPSLAVVFGLDWLMGAISGGDSTSHGESRLWGLLSVVLDFFLVIGACMLPGKIVAGAGALFKNRSGLIAGALGGLVAFLASVVLFWPLFEGHSLAPTDITFIFIPVKWVLIVVGATIVPFGGWAVARDAVNLKKFCEEGNVYLPASRRMDAPLGEGQLLTDSLALGMWPEVAKIPRVSKEEAKTTPTIQLQLFSHPSAKVGYAELTAKYVATSEAPKKTKTSDWLAYSRKLTQDECRALASAMPQ
jgi:hypothetical protein